MECSPLARVLATAKQAMDRNDAKEAIMTLLRIDLTQKNTENEDAYNAALVAGMAAIRVDEATKEFLNPLDPIQQDLLMKAIYAGFKPTPKPGSTEMIPQKADVCQQLLKWHAILLEKAGIGAVVRAISERCPPPGGFVEEELDDD
ncbi:hypothetical protein PAPYR_9074 [Paratrimastix pyriformis]|uniref:Actin-related protein 2/3 complex subunit 5 n=1 Tax=Paratrimastix pyriformis TaxID=342808 RepID=A0ABQ8UDB2_9EUKA|nr:hypothetical protein PAPYR_9074 [Paratrimastix pyriformis]|eukprot:GAFH01005503.1.p1 GENE.GAFH01005503.1~~GAFH01005503.1.p1  ORF type:complete len:146 (-),score=36.09 GAFH01005503.1:164-601(-)